MRARWLVVLALGLLGCERQASPPPPGAGAPSSSGGPIEEARALIEQGQADAALAKLEGAPPDAEALYLQGRAWAKKAESAPLPTPPPLAAPLPAGAAAPAAPEFKPEELRALDLYEKSIAARPSFAPAHMALAELLAPHAIERQEREWERRRQAAAALAARRRGRKGRPPEPLPPLPAPEGPDASVDRVVQAYRQAIQADAASSLAVDGLIAFAVRAGRLEEADSAFQELVRRKKEDPEPLIRFGDFLAESRKEPQRAITQYAQALIWRPEDEATKAKIANIYLEMARAHLAQNEYASAEARLQDAQRYVADKSSPEGLKIQDIRAELGQIRRPAGK
jgi:hypothetical protein